VVGLSNGLAVMADEETRSLWDHITGEAFEGPLAGERLDWWPIRLTTTGAALAEWPTLVLLVSDYRSVAQMVMGRVKPKKIHTKGWLPPGFRATMSAPVDPRLGELAQGLGVIVDDEAPTRKVTARMLAKLGFQVMEAAGGKEGVSLFRNHSEEIVGVLLDLTMPDLSGEETYREIRRIKKKTPVLLMSGYTETEVAGRFPGRRVSGFLQKPFLLPTLRTKLEALFK